MLRLEAITQTMATNGRALEDSEQKKYMRGLSQAVGVKEETKFNRDKFEQLRAFGG
ncbi:hypothetical protein [Mesobacillus zeae]|uniref:hypothetical protein n=1 Tax=Mesobacillus zeae TaxID=1917180 RepID=UPI00300B2FE9